MTRFGVLSVVSFFTGGLVLCLRIAASVVVPLWECGSPFRKRLFYSSGIVNIVYYSYCK